MTEETKWSAVFDAQALHIVAPFRDTGNESYSVLCNLHGIRVEPCPAGGVLLIATDGRALAIARSDGMVKGGPKTVYLPSSLIAACAPPKIRKMVGEGCEWTPNAPKWMIPGKVSLSECHCMVMHQAAKAEGSLYCDIANAHSPARDDDYRLLGDDYPDWRRVIPAELQPIRQPLPLNPEYLSLLSEVNKIGSDLSGIGGVQIVGQGAGVDTWGGPIVFRHQSHADFLACIMPMRDSDVNTGLPEWLGAPQ